MADSFSPKQQLRKSSSVLGQKSPVASPALRPDSSNPAIRSTSPRPAAGSPHVGPDRSKDDERLFDIDLLAEEARAQEVVQTLSQHKMDVAGWRLRVIMACIFTGLFLSFLDTTIVGIALATIASRFDAFESSSWVFTAYLLTYMTFGIVLARLSDFFGLKSIEFLSLLIFLAFSVACGAAQNMTQLILFRAFQGIGGSGLISMTFITVQAAVPLKKIGEVATWVSLTQAVAMVLGPILSGAITHRSGSEDWRWIFYLNLPVGFLALGGLIVAWPRSVRSQEGTSYRMSMESLEGVDFVGAGLLLAASVMLIFSLQEAGAEASEWNSGVIIESFVISGVAFTAFVIWEVWIGGKKDWKLKPIFPMEVVPQRVVASTMLVTVLNGFIWYLIILALPNRYQLVHGDSPAVAGARLLPMAFASAAGTFTGGVLSCKVNLTGYSFIAAGAIQLAGYGLMSTLSLEDSSTDIRNSYGFSILIGFGFGLSIASTTLATIFRFLPEPQHAAVLQGCVAQMRSLGGSIGLAVATIIFNYFVHASVELADMLSDQELDELYRSPLAMGVWDDQVQEEVAYVYAKAFKSQMRVAMYVAVAALVVSFGCLERQPAPVGGSGDTSNATNSNRRESVESVEMG